MTKTRIRLFMSRYYYHNIREFLRVGAVVFILAFILSFSNNTWAGLDADFNGDGEVDMVDYATLAQYWVDTDCTIPGNCEGADFEPDGDVDLYDLAEFVSYWLATLPDIIGSGITNYIPKFTGSATIGDSVIHESSGKVGVGTTSPDDKLTITDQGNIKLQDDRPPSTARSTYIGTVADGGAINIGQSGGAQIEFEHLANNNDRLHFITNDSRAMTIDYDVEFGIGYDNPQARLVVNGTVGIGTDDPVYDFHVVDPSGNGAIRLESGGPQIIFKENDQQGYGPDVGYWRIVADLNGKGIECWENGNGQVGNEFDTQDEYWSVARADTQQSGPSPVGDHIIQWQYSLRGNGERDLQVGANWANTNNPQTARKLSFVAIDQDANSLVETINIIPNDAAPKVTFPNGNVGIGEENPSYILQVKQNSSTDPIADAWTTYSSKRWKTNIKPIEGAMEKVKRLRGVSFDWKKDGKGDIGVIAEEVGQVLPEVVVYEKDGKDAAGLDYGRLVAVLVEGFKEQQDQIELIKDNLQKKGFNPTSRKVHHGEKFQTKKNN